MSDDHETPAGKPACPHQVDAMAFLQNELPVDERVWFERHRQSCPSCREQVEAYGKVLARMAASPGVPLESDLAPAILARIPDRAWLKPTLLMPIRIFLPRFARIAALFLVLAAAVSLVVVVSREDSGTTAAPTAAVEEPQPAVGAPAAEPPSREAAIAVGLAWLEANQEPDGAWDAGKWGAPKDHTVGITALSLLALLNDPGRHTQAVDRAIEYLGRQQNADGLIGPACDNAMYNHGIATVALLKAVQAGRINMSNEICSRAIAHICRSQKISGGWSYSKESAESENTSLSVWQIQSLMLAESMGRKDMAPRIQQSMAWLKSMVNGDGQMGYTRAGDFPNGPDAMTAAGLLCLYDRDSAQGAPSRTGDMVKALEGAAADRGEPIDYYRSYFLTRALRKAGGDLPRKLASSLQGTLIAQQSLSGPSAGSWEPADRWSAAGGRIYNTSMAVLALE